MLGNEGKHILQLDRYYFAGVNILINSYSAVNFDLMIPPSFDIAKLIDNNILNSITYWSFLKTSFLYLQLFEKRKTRKHSAL